MAWTGLKQLVSPGDLAKFGLRRPAAAWSVGALLSQVVARLPYVQLREYGRDILSIHETPEVEKPLPDQRVAAEKCLAVRARSATSLMPVWLRLSPAERRSG